MMQIQAALDQLRQDLIAGTPDADALADAAAAFDLNPKLLERKFFEQFHIPINEYASAEIARRQFFEAERARNEALALAASREIIERVTANPSVLRNLCGKHAEIVPGLTGKELILDGEKHLFLCFTRGAFSFCALKVEKSPQVIKFPSNYFDSAREQLGF